MLQVECIQKTKSSISGDAVSSAAQQEMEMPAVATSLSDNVNKQVATPPLSPIPPRSYLSSSFQTSPKYVLAIPRIERTESECVSSRDSSSRFTSIDSCSRSLSRTLSSPQLFKALNSSQRRNIFHDLSPRSLRLLEVKSWKCPWMDMDFGINAPVENRDSEQNSSNAAQDVTRPKLKLKLFNMPTTQQAEERAQKAAARLAVRRSSTGGSVLETTNHQRSVLRLRLNSFSSIDECELSSPDYLDSRSSVGSQWSPNHGRFTTKNMSVSEAGISSPDAVYLHLQHDLARVGELGRGASGVVHKAIHIPTLKVVAIKDVPVYGKGHRQQMVRELNALYSNLVPIAGHFGKNSCNAETSTGETRRPSPHIVSFYDAFVDKAKNCVCMVMEYMDMGSLQDLVLKGGCQSERILARIASCVLQGLYHIHGNRMVHRDIKPHNLLINRMGDVKISDFGLARTLNDNVDQTKTFVGTLLYMAPERIGGGDYSYAADIWSFGLSLMAVAMGKYPLPTADGFFGLVDSVGSDEFLNLPDHFSNEFKDFMNKCLQIDPTKRPSAKELLSHQFLSVDNFKDTLDTWKAFADSSGLVETAEECLDALVCAVYDHYFENALKFTYQTQSEYGASIISRFTTPYRRTSFLTGEYSLQLGLAKTLDIPPEMVYFAFEKKREVYNTKLLDDSCISPQSWSSSPGYTTVNPFLKPESNSSPEQIKRHRHSVWRRLHDRVKRFGQRKSKATAVDHSRKR